MSICVKSRVWPKCAGCHLSNFLERLYPSVFLCLVCLNMCVSLTEYADGFGHAMMNVATCSGSRIF